MRKRLRAGLQGDVGSLVELERELGVGKRADDLVKLLRLHRDRAVAFDLCATPGGERDVEIGGGESELAVASVEQQVREDGDRRPALDDALHQSELREQGVTLETKFHSLSSLRGSLCSGSERVGNIA